MSLSPIHQRESIPGSVVVEIDGLFSVAVDVDTAEPYEETVDVLDYVAMAADYHASCESELQVRDWARYMTSCKAHLSASYVSRDFGSVIVRMYESAIREAYIGKMEDLAA